MIMMEYVNKSNDSDLDPGEGKCFISTMTDTPSLVVPGTLIFIHNIY